MPDLSRETAAGGMVAGVDEVGRGPWAGPVVAGAVVFAPGAPAGLLSRLDDSKTLTARRRKALALELADLAVAGGAWIGLGAASPDEIDAVDILRATFRAMGRALEALGVAPTLALVDGNRAPPFACPVQTVVRGDAVSASIAAASIVAKVHRDRLMADLSLRHPGYGWERNAGYGTAEHRAALDRLGVTQQHRRTFAPVAAVLARSSEGDVVAQEA